MQRRPSRYALQSALLAVALVSSFALHNDLRAQGNVGIGTTSPDASALLDLTSTSRGLLVPRMTQTQRSAITSPATGLLVYCTDSVNSSNPSTYYYYNGTAWVPLMGSGWLLTGNSGTSATNNFLGTKDSVDFVVRTNNTERVRVYAGGGVGLTNSNNSAEELRFYEPSGSGSTYTSFKAGVQTASVTYTLPTSDGTASNYVLCTDGFGNLSWKGFGYSGGGGVDTLWKRGTGSFSLIGLGTNNTAAGAYAITAGSGNTASGNSAVAFGNDNIASGAYSSVPGGQFDTASGDYSIVGGGNNNSATAAYAEVGGGENNAAGGQYSVVVGGYNNRVTGNYSAILGGNSNTVTGNASLAFGIGATVTTDNTIVFYHNNAATKVGIGTTSPSESLDINGSLKFSGALMPSGLAGTSGYVLASTGSGSAPTWVQPSNLYWNILGNSGTTVGTNFLGTIDSKDLVVKTNNTERMRVLAGGQVGIGVTTTTHQLHSVYSGTSDETAAIYGATSSASTSQTVGVWGAASNTGSTNTGTIGVLATGNGASTATSTNVALQLNDGQFAMGRTTEAPSAGSVVESAAGGTAYSQQGPSGVIELTLGSSGNLTTVPPVAGVFQNLGAITVNNRYADSTSIIVTNVLSKNDDGILPDPKSAVYFVDVDNRTTGAFDIRIGMMPTATNASNYSVADKIRIGYEIITAGK